jgi:hypothetical protein
MRIGVLVILLHCFPSIFYTDSIEMIYIVNQVAIPNRLTSTRRCTDIEQLLLRHPLPARRIRADSAIIYHSTCPHEYTVRLCLAVDDPIRIFNSPIRLAGNSRHDNQVVLAVKGVSSRPAYGGGRLEKRSISGLTRHHCPSRSPRASRTVSTMTRTRTIMLRRIEFEEHYQ